MATKKTKAAAPPASNPLTLPLKADAAIKEMTREQKLAILAVHGEMSIAATVAEFSKGAYGKLSWMDCSDALADQVKDVRKGSLRTSETLLTCQAVALNTIFTELARRAANNMGEHLETFERYLRLALKAQNQCRATLETLAAIKNPPVVFAKQANINQGNGNQQVNNGTPSTASHAEKNINQRNELLEVQHGSETLDTRTTGATISHNPAMETVETLHRGAHA